MLFFWVPISCSVKKQTTISRSLIEVEYRSLATDTTDMLWIWSLFTELGVQLLKPTILWCDNQITITLVGTSMLHAKAKHIEIYLYFVQDRIQDGSLFV